VRGVPVLTSRVYLRLFMKLCGHYYRHFVDAFAHITVSLTFLRWPHSTWYWGTTEQQPMDLLKACLIAVLFLRAFNSCWHSILIINAWGP
jgi:hypothetical protein